MKKGFIFILSLFLAASPALLSAAQEAVLPESLSAGALKGQAQDTFGVTIFPNGTLSVKPGAVFSVGKHEGMELPYLLSASKSITYPRWAVRQGWQGQMNIALEILPNGHVGRIKTMKSTGHKMLDEAGEKAVKSWKFHPATKDGKSVVTCIQVPISFYLQNS